MEDSGFMLLHFEGFVDVGFTTYRGFVNDGFRVWG